MSAADSLQRPLDAQSNQVNNLGDPTAVTDATHVTADSTLIKDTGNKTYAGDSFLAAPVDHSHELVEQIDPVELQRNFRLLLRAYVEQGFPIPDGLEHEFEESDKYK